MMLIDSVQAKQTGIQDLPANLLVAVLGHLDSRSLLQKAPTVCKAWKTACKGALQELDVSRANTVAKAKGAATLMLHGSTLSKLSYQVNNRLNETMLCQLILYKALVQLTQLQSLDLLGFDLRGKTQALTSLQRLTSLRLACCNLTDPGIRPLSVLVALRQLSLEGSTSIDAGCPHFINLSRALTQLTSLNLASCEEFDNPRGLSELKALQELDLSHLQEIELEELPAMPSLTKLDFSCNWAVLDKDSTVKVLFGLQDLRMQGSYFGDEANRFSRLVSLTRLEATHGEERGDGTRCVLLTALGPLQQLCHLVVSSDFRQTEPVSSFSVLGTLQHLTHLELRGPQLPAGALAAMLYSTSQVPSAWLPRLQSLQVVHEEHGEKDAQQAPGGPISSNDVALLVRKCPGLQSLTISGYEVENGGLLHLSSLRSLTALTFRAAMPGNVHNDQTIAVLLM
jgi:hypothetical protein